MKKKVEKPILPIVMFSMSRWDSHISSASYCLAKEFAQSRKIYYIDMPYTWLDIIKYYRRQDIKKRFKLFFAKKKSLLDLSYVRLGLRVIIPYCVPPINWLPQGLLFNKIQQLNDRLVCRKIARILKNDGVGEYLYFNSFNPFFGRALTEIMSPRLKIYQSRDDIETLDYVSKHGPKLEIHELKRADLCYATSEYLREKLARKSKTNVILLNNGVEIDIFLDQQIGTSPTKSEAIIFFSGNLDKRVDFNLFLKTMRAFPEIKIVIVGPISSEEFYSKQLDKEPNVEIMGGMPIEKMAGELAKADVAIIPFVRNEQTKSIYPLKVNEYLACGKPIVTTNFSDDLNTFGDLISIANTDEQFIELINKELGQNNVKKKQLRIAKAKTNSWSSRVQKIEEDVDALL